MYSCFFVRVCEFLVVIWRGGGGGGVRGCYWVPRPVTLFIRQRILNCIQICFYYKQTWRGELAPVKNVWIWLKALSRYSCWVVV